MPICDSSRRRARDENENYPESHGEFDSFARA